MLPKLKIAFSAIVFASFLIVSASAYSQQVIQTVDGLSSEMMTNINNEMKAAAESGDTTALEDLMTSLAEANPELAGKFTEFVSNNLPTQLPADMIDTLLTSVTSAIIVGAPEATVEVTGVIETLQPEFVDSVSSGLEASLLGMDFNTAAGGNDDGGAPAGFNTAAGTPAGPRLPAAPRTGARQTAENPSTNSASPTG
mgnify:CR=1 FL=1